MTTTGSIHENIAVVQQKIEAACTRKNRSPDDVKLVAVSKQHPPEMVLAAMNAGIRHFGENRVEEAVEKIPAVGERVTERPTWHMIGHIQSRKARSVLPVFDVVESIDRLKIARILSDEAQASGRRLPVLVEVNISGENAKYGFPAFGWEVSPTVKDKLWRDIETLLHLPNLTVRGLMTLAPYYDEMEQARPVFSGLARLRDTLQQSFGVALPDLSMGMTNDYPVAVEEGATIVRIGRAIFGERDHN